MTGNREKWGIRYLPVEHSYPHSAKIQMNLLYLLSMVEALSPIKKTLLEKRKLPSGSGIVTPYPRADFIELNYIALLKELLIETAVFIRGHDDFWGKKGGKKWSELVKDFCGTTRFISAGASEKEINLDLRGACDKLIHYTSVDFGYEGDEENTCFILQGEKQGKDWQARVYLKNFCYTALRLMFPC